MNDNVRELPKRHVPKQGVDHLPGQLDLIDHAAEGAPPAQPVETPTEPAKETPEEIHPLEAPDTTPANVVRFGGITRRDIPVDHVLKDAFDSGLTDVVIAGFTPDGEEFFASSMADGAEIVWLLERTKLKLLKIVDQ